MALWWVNGQVVDDQQGHVPKGSMPVPTYQNQAQYGDQRFSWDPANRYFSGNIQNNAPGYLTEMLGRAGRPLQPWEADELRQWEATARAMPMRDIGALTAGWQGELGGSWTENGWQAGNPQWWSLLDPGSPDAGPIMLHLKDKIAHGYATPQERQLYHEVATMAADWDWRASVPQESDANPFGMGDNLFGALMMLGMGASGGAAGAALATGGLTLGSAGGLAGAASGLTSMFGQALDSKALQQAAMALGFGGGAAGLTALLSSGVSSVGDVLKLVQKGVGLGQKGMGLASSFGGSGEPHAAGGGQGAQRSVGAPSSAQGGSGAGSTGGGGMDLSQIGTVLSGVVGLVGSGLSLADTSRYMDQLKAQYGDQQEIKDLIDGAYRLAVARYETTYARNEAEYAQKQKPTRTPWRNTRRTTSRRSRSTDRSRQPTRRARANSTRTGDPNTSSTAMTA